VATVLIYLFLRLEYKVDNYGDELVQLDNWAEIYEENRDESTTCTILEKSYTSTS
jgi:hypothetical protein